MRYFKLSITVTVIMGIGVFLLLSVGRFKHIFNNPPGEDSDVTYDEFALNKIMVKKMGDVYLESGERILKENLPAENLSYDLSQSLGNIFSYIDPMTNVNALDETLYGQVQIYTSGLYKKNKADNFRGADVILTICSDYQIKMFQLLEGTGGQAILINYKTGDILAAVAKSKKYSLYDCTEIQNYETDQNGKIKYDFYSCNSLTSFPIYPGSTIKPLIAISILNTDGGDGLLEYSYQCDSGTSEMGREKHYSMTCYRGVGHGTITLQEALSKSCNKFLLNYCYDNNISKEQVIKNMEGLGLGGSNDNHLTSFYMRTGVYCIDENFSFHMAGIGEGDCRIPLLGIATAYCGLANKGIVAKPRFVKAYKDNEEYINLNTEKTRITTEEYAVLLSNMLRETTVSGTGRQLAFLNDRLQLSCKTGSAEYDENNTHKLCISYSNNEDFPYLIAVDISELQGQALDFTEAMWEYVLLQNEGE